MGDSTAYFKREPELAESGEQTIEQDIENMMPEELLRIGGTTSSENNFSSKISLVHYEPRAARSQES